MEIEGELGLPLTIAALLMIIALFGAAFWFIRYASRTNMKFRWLQVLDQRRRRTRGQDNADDTRQ